MPVTGQRMNELAALTARRGRLSAASAATLPKLVGRLAAGATDTLLRRRLGLFDLVLDV